MLNLEELDQIVADPRSFFEDAGDALDYILATCMKEGLMFVFTYHPDNLSFTVEVGLRAYSDKDGNEMLYNNPVAAIRAALRLLRDRAAEELSKKEDEDG